MNPSFSRDGGPAALRLHWPLLACTLSIAALGVYNMHSSAGLRVPTLWVTQACWLLLGLCAMLAVVRIDYRATRDAAYAAFGGTCTLLVLVLVLGKSVMGARRWLSLGPLSFQPSELAKLAIIFGMARYLAQRAPANGYSIRALVRPLLWTRPVGAAAIALAAWRKAWLVDPLGELARAVHRRLPAPPPIETLYWCRVLCLTSLALSLFVSVGLVQSAATRAALLSPWPRTRKRRVLLIVAAVHAALLGNLAWHWYAPSVTDPLGVALRALWHAGAPGGALSVPHATWGPRLLLLGLVSAYGAAAYAFGRRISGEAPGHFVAPIDLVAVPSLLVLVQPDLGSAIMIACTGMTMVLVVGLKARSFVYLGALSLFFSVLGWFALLKDYQKRRIWTFIDPEQDVRGAGWNAVQSLIAVGSGRFFGKGHKNGTQTQLSFLPEQHTDFAFSVWAEEQGFFGCCVLLLLYLLLVALGVQVAMRARDAYGALLAAGVTSLLLWHAVVNVGMVIGVLPVVGIPLPLFSYGGSSVLVVMASIGVLLNVHLQRRSR